MKSITPTQREQARRTADKYLPRADEPAKPLWVIRPHAEHLIIAHRDGSFAIPIADGVKFGNQIIMATRTQQANAMVKTKRRRA